MRPAHLTERQPVDGRQLKQLVLTYDQGLLVPFVGSGMSTPACALWPRFVAGLERQAELIGHVPSRDSGLIEKAHSAMRALRLAGVETRECVRAALYAGCAGPAEHPSPAEVSDTEDAPEQTAALARLYWPLVCTTNYDDVYFRAQKGQRPRGPLYVLGRSARDCHDLLRELRFPTRELLWAVQGFLRPRCPEHRIPANLIEQLEQEIVVGHAEYRDVANREPHFRRTFAELFRTRSFLFLGSGLSEPYFRQLFDETIALTGPTERPHYAIIPEGEIDREFMRQNYNIECIQYPDQQHQQVACALNTLAGAVNGPRARRTAWGFRLGQTSRVDSGASIEHFKVVRGPLPRPATLPWRDALAISCGIAADGRPLVNPELARNLDVPASGFPVIRNADRIVQHEEASNTYGIVAREPQGDRRSPRVVRTAFEDALRFSATQDVETLHVQLLAAGPNRAFRPWISLVQMARAYGNWFRTKPDNRVRVRLYVVDPGVLALLQGSFIDLAEHLEDTGIRISIQTYPGAGASRHQRIVDPSTPVATLINDYPAIGGMPRIDVSPPFHSYPRGRGQGTEARATVEDLGLVSGSTLFLDYRPEGRRGPSAR